MNIHDRWTSLDEETKSAIKLLHKKLAFYKARPDLYGSPKTIANVVEGFEYTLQVLWGFDPNPSFHTHWYEIKGCTCPKMDNSALFGVDTAIINVECPFHGSLEVTDE